LRLQAKAEAQAQQLQREKLAGSKKEIGQTAAAVYQQLSRLRRQLAECIRRRMSREASTN
jgi:hypothetical protein